MTTHFRQGWKRKFPAQQGLTVIEILLALGLLAVFSLVVMTGYSSIRKFQLNTMSQNNLTLIMDFYRSLLIEDIQTAGMGLANQTGNRLVVKDADSGKARPAVFLDEEGNKLTVVATDQTGAGELIAGTVATGTLVLGGVDFTKWQPLTGDSLVMAVNPTGPPVLLKLTNAPRLATASDLPPEEDGALNLNRTMVLQVSPLDTCNHIATLSTEVDPKAFCVPVTRVVRYGLGKGGVEREELSTCSEKLKPGITPGEVPSTVPMTPGLTAEESFSYLTTSGLVKKFPGDGSTLLGIHVETAITDPTTNKNERASFNVYFENWK
ncbi:MAG: type II secretion system GspH family protein [Blastocatellia bacterium]|nr:type II secretion system GspH family protein [Blastocatellia bacterium]